jgi:hypothetical protein
MKWVILYAGWVILWLSFFCPNEIKEQIIAFETILCTFLKPEALHIVVITFVVVYFTQTGHRPDAWASIVHHIIIALTVLVQYIEPNYQIRCWVALCWSSRWLGSFLIYSSDTHPVRECLKCILFYIVVQCHKSWRFSKKYEYKDSIRWLWILFVNEIAWLCLPIQMLYEVYSTNSILPT